jgi:hypothetical protein
MNNITAFLRDFTYGSSYELLEVGKNDEELKEIAEKRGIVLPAMDLSVFKCRYAYIDRTNLNGCALPKEEVEQSLQTLVGKAIDFDHYRGRVVGVWIDSKIEGNEIIAYGIFFKGNLADDYDIIQDLLKQGRLRVSFEAYGNRDFKEDGTYDLTDIEFAGGALLISTNPAFPGAEVLEMSNKRMLELASTLKEPSKFLHNTKEKFLEKSRFYAYDFETVMRMLGEVKCPKCEAEYSMNVDVLDFEGSKLKTTCVFCAAICSIEMTPKTSVIGERKIASIAIDNKDKEVSTTNKGESEPMKDEKKLEETSSEVKAEETLPVVAKEEEVVDSPAEDLKKDEAEEAKAEEVPVTATTTETTTPEQPKEEKPSETATQETVQETEEVKQLKSEIELLKAELQKKEEEIKVKVEEARVQTTKLIERKTVLGEFGKNISEAEILDDKQFEILRLRKENEELKTAKLEVSSLEVGAEDKVDEKGKEDNKEEDKDFTLQKKIQGKAFKIKK